MSKRVANKKGKGAGARCERKVGKYGRKTSARKQLELVQDQNEIIDNMIHNPILQRPVHQFSPMQRLKKFLRRTP